jgi:hypothetical protein
MQCSAAQETDHSQYSSRFFSIYSIKARRLAMKPSS